MLFHQLYAYHTTWQKNVEKFSLLKLKIRTYVVVRGEGENKRTISITYLKKQVIELIKYIIDDIKYKKRIKNMFDL